MSTIEKSKKICYTLSNRVKLKFQMPHIPKISVTGTKGKTTVVNVLAALLRQLDHDVLKVDTTGHYVNGEQRSSLEDSKTIWNLVPSVCPGRYLYEFKTDSNLAASQQPVAVLESALGCSASSGLGYREHEVGVFLNVLEDHIGSSPRLQSKADIAVAKNFIFRRVRQAGYVVFNADDEFVVGELQSVPAEREVTLIPVGLTFANFDVERHLADGGVAVTLAGTEAVLKSRAGDVILFDLAAIPWSFDATFQPSIYNLLFAAAAAYGHFKGNLPAKFREAMEAVRLDKYGGRLTLLKAENGATILADYAHEKFSLGLVGDLARTLLKDDGKVIGIVRLAYDRSPDLIAETGQAIASHYDELFVYDKIDGHFVKGETKPGRRFQKVPGLVSQQLTDAIETINPRVTRIIREDEVIAAVARQAGPNDCIVFIVNDDIKQSLEYVKNSFKARFI